MRTGLTGLLRRVEVLLQEGHGGDALRHPGGVRLLLAFEQARAGAQPEQPRAVVVLAGV